MLESFLHGDSSFVTLTYDEKHLPPGGNLVPKDAVDWLKRLRRSLAPRKVRYYLAGEYGEVTGRPHFHLALFGLSPIEFDLVHDTWGNGHVLVGELNFKSAQYVAGYVTKKLSSKEDPRLCGMIPEFSRMSRRPGIGADAMSVVGSSLMAYASLLADVPHVLMHGKKSYPLGRYLMGKLREKVGRSAETPKGVLEKYVGEMQELYGEAAVKAPLISRLFGKKRLFLDMNAQRMLNESGKLKIFDQKRGKI